MDSVSDKPKDKRQEVEERTPGELSLIEMSDEEVEDFLDYMEVTSGNSYLDLLYTIIGKDKLLLYMEVLENVTVKMPTKKVVYKIVSYIKMYNYLKKKGFTEEAYESASKLYKKRAMALKRIVVKVEEVLKRADERV